MYFLNFSINTFNIYKSEAFSIVSIMKTNRTLIAVIFILSSLLPDTGNGQDNSVLSSGQWYKLAISKSDIYKIDQDFLIGMGIDPSIDPRNIAIYGYGGGMLPQENDAERPVDLPENAIMVVGESDGSFDGDDYVLFFGQSPDKIEFTASGVDNYQKNLYSDLTYYFLTIKNQPGKRAIAIKNEGTSFPTISTYDDHFIFEEDSRNLIDTGREWYGQLFTRNENLFEIKFPITNIVNTSPLKITSAVMAASVDPTSFDLHLNGTSIGTQEVGVISGATYDIKGVDRTDIFNINTDDLDQLEQGINLTYTFNTPPTGPPVGFHNYVIIEAERKLEILENSIQFRSIKSLVNEFSTFEIRGADSETFVWDISDPQSILFQEFELVDNTLKFGTSTRVLREFMAVKEGDLEAPEFIQQIDNQNIKGITTPDGLIITHPDFLSEAIRIGSFRSSNDGLDVDIVTTDEIYNEFSSGRQDISAIRNFIKHLYEKGGKLKYVLLFGDASYDYKERTISDNTNYVPIYEARNSLHPIFSYSSDDYYGFMDDDEGFWEESEAGDHLLEIGIGRLPASSLKEATILVDKLIDYATNDASMGNWRNELYFVADDGDFNIHQRDADELARFVDDKFAAFNPNKIYLDAFPQKPTANGRQTATTVTQAINEAIDKGSLIFNFTGHGNDRLWCEEEILNQKNIRDLNNRNRLPLFVTATCEFGKYDNPNIVSGGELLLLNENGGAIGLLTTSRPVFSNTNFLLNKAFYNNVFKKDEDGQFPRLGDIIRKTKNESTRGPVNRNFALLGDPMMKLAYPTYDLEITELNGEDLTTEGDTIRALGLTQFKGRVIDLKGQHSSNFSGILSVKVFDTPGEFVTLGNESNPTTFSQRNSLIFRGDVTIENGFFDFEFVVPKNITYLFEEAKVSLYAQSDDMIDANGANINLKIGGSDQNAPTDNTGPDLELFLNNEDFQSGGRTSANPLLLAKIFDENGINISEAGVGQNISLVIDDESEISLNDFYSADLDSYQSGAIRFPLSDLEEGKHTLVLKLFDTYNNSTTKTIDFFVSGDAKSAISDVISYPNPIRERTTFVISHNRIGENLGVRVEIFSLNGDLTQILNAELFDNTGTINQLEWDRTNMNGARVRAGIYISKIILETEDGAGLAYHKLLVID